MSQTTPLVADDDELDRLRAENAKLRKQMWGARIAAIILGIGFLIVTCPAFRH